MFMHHEMLRSLGVTGTNGKTTTTTWIAAALAVLHRPVLRCTTLGYFLDDEQIETSRGFAGFLQATRVAMERHATFAAIELTSQALGNGAARAWPCEVGVFTNFTHDHLDSHRTAEHYLASKAQLFLSLCQGGTAVLNGCDPSFSLLREILPTGVGCTSYGVETRGKAMTDVDLRVTEARLSWEGTTMSMEAKAFGSRTFTTRGVGAIYAENAAAALLGAIAMGVPFDLAVDAIARTPAPPGRFDLVARRPYVVIDYAHTPDAILRTCQTAQQLCDGGEVIVVFGAGGNRDRGKRAEMGRSASGADRIILTTDNSRDEDAAEIAADIRGGLSGHAHVEVELDRERAIARAVTEARAGDVVLVCGKGHETDQVTRGQTIHFSDREAVARAVAVRSAGGK